MAKTKDVKNQIYSDYKEKLSAYQSLVLLDMSATKTQAVEGLKNKLGESKYVLVKNTIFAKAVNEVNPDIDLTSLQGQTGAVFSSEDPSEALKIVMEFLKENTTASVKTGIIDKKLVSKEDLKEIATLPSKIELIAKAVGGIKAPLSSFVNVLSGVQRNFLVTLKAIEAQKQ